ncbi:cysteine desulfurase [Salinibacterium sp. dk2585]|uniref:cysteine desulfurase family protein n=1 Tax=unclassified Salinibacterium TaxID=2632331 RepID=UPI0011C25306|nr:MULTISPECIES: cysteine desulfurase family protein [unclassified Salinibacterium]QEE61386.1 cysteine desulfurase [Salinibacterium sp. dk2585]TXK54063.1 cysteine desulfurase [Salinibacterium sp. dk5596]
MPYLDVAATAPVRREVLEAMTPFLTTEFGNPSSHHELGERAASALEWARTRVASVLGCRPGEIVFTSGGTESNNLAIKGISLANPRGRHIVTTAIEHPSVLESCAYLERFHGFTVEHVPVDGDGLVDPLALERMLRPDTTLVSVMLANNEVGTVQPLAEIGATTRAAGVPLHSDAVQAAGWLDLRLRGAGGEGGLPVEALTLAGHKLGAPKGVGALFVGGRIPLEPLVHGGGQEAGRRSGTENVAGAVGLATALTLAEAERASRAEEARESRDVFIATILSALPGARLTGHAEARLPGNASFCFEGTSGEAVLLELERRGIVCSSGSACAAGSDEPSPVLLALGIDPTVAQTAVRFTFAATTPRPHLLAAAESVIESVRIVQGIASR